MGNLGLMKFVNGNSALVQFFSQRTGLEKAVERHLVAGVLLRQGQSDGHPLQSANLQRLRQLYDPHT